MPSSQHNHMDWRRFLWLLIQDPDWRQRLQNPDAVFGHSTPAVSNVSLDADLADPNAVMPVTTETSPAPDASAAAGLANPE